MAAVRGVAQKTVISSSYPSDSSLRGTAVLLLGVLLSYFSTVLLPFGELKSISKAGGSSQGKSNRVAPYPMKTSVTLQVWERQSALRSQSSFLAFPMLSSPSQDSGTSAERGKEVQNSAMLSVCANLPRCESHDSRAGTQSAQPDSMAASFCGSLERPGFRSSWLLNYAAVGPPI